MVGGEGEDPLLGHGALDVVVLHDHVLLQDLDRVHLLGILLLREHHLKQAGSRLLLQSQLASSHICSFKKGKILFTVHLVWFKGDRLRGTISKFWAIQWDS